MDQTATELERLTARLDDVERQLRWFKRAALCLVGAFGALAFFAAAPQSTATQKLVIRDAAGHDRVIITPGALNFYNENGARKVFLGQAADGTPLLRMRDSAGTERVDMFVAKDNTPQLSLYDNKARARAIMQASDEPFFGLKDDTDKYRASMYLTKSGTPTVDLNRRNGELVASLFQDRGGEFGDVALYGAGETKRFLAVGSDTPYLALYAPIGTEKWSAP